MIREPASLEQLGVSSPHFCKLDSISNRTGEVPPVGSRTPDVSAAQKLWSISCSLEDGFNVTVCAILSLSASLNLVAET